MFGLGILKGTLIGLAGGVVIGLTIREGCKLINSKKTNPTSILTIMTYQKI